MMDELPNPSQVYRLLMQEQRHKETSKVTALPTDHVAFVADKQKYYDRKTIAASHSSNGGKRNNCFCDTVRFQGTLLKCVSRFRDILTPTSLFHTKDLLPSL